MSDFLKARRAEARRVTEATDWFLRLREDDVDEAQLAAWFEWCAIPDNLKEFERISRVWRGFGQLADRSPDASSSQSTYAAGGARRPVHIRHLAWAAALLVTVIGTAVLVPWPAWYGKSGYKAHAAMRSDDLPDGSRVTLAPHSALSVDFSDTLRKVVLPSGEVFFRVHPDKSKPFVVSAGDVSVVAVGTAFDVKIEADRTVVTVQEGTVEVASQMRADAHAGESVRPWRVERGSELVFDRKTGSVRIAAVEADRIVAWHSGRLEYVAAPLSQVVTDVSRYSAHAVEIGDPRLSPLTYTGAVLTNSVDDWLAALQTAFPIRVVTAQDGHLILLSASR